MATSEAALGPVRDVRVNGATIRYHDTGAGAPIVFIHGVLVNADLWRKVVPLLADRHRCISPDLPLGAHQLPTTGRADLSPPGLAKLIDQFLAALDLDNVTIVANDTGGGLTQVLVAQRPQRVGRIVLTPCEVGGPPAFLAPSQALGYVPGAYWLTAHTLFRLKPFVRFLFRQLAHTPIDQDVLDSYVRPGLSNRAVVRDFGRAFRQLRPRYLVPALEQLPEFGKPALVVWADGDRFFSPEHGRRLAELLGAKLEVVNDSRTFVPEDQPERLAELIDEFLKQWA
jgi:pimeloyl-ACP methyl ester carboxylesterase